MVINMYFQQPALRNVLAAIIVLIVIPDGNTLECAFKLHQYTYKMRDNSTAICLTCLSFLNIDEYIGTKECKTARNALDEQGWQEIHEYKTEYDESDYEDTPRYGVMKHAIKIEEDYDLTTIESGPDLSISGDYFVLILWYNNIQFIAPRAFSNFVNLLILNLASNDIITLDSGVFYGLVQLQILNLQFNKIEVLNDNIFESLGELFEIDLSNNKLTYIPPNLFIHQEHLSVVLLNNNEIAALECICWNSPKFIVDQVDLSWNKINKTHLKTKVKQLLLDHNKLVNFTSESIEFNELRLDCNNLTEFNVNLSTTLQSLNLSVNRISNISEYTFSHALELLSLNLSNNQLKSLPTSSMRILEKLQFLDISDNFLSESSYGSENNWLSLFLHLNNLQGVSLDGNLWKCSDLKQMVQTFKFRSIPVTPGNEHKKSNILGISCFDNSKDELANSSINPEFIEKVFEEMWNRLTNKSHIGSQLLNLSMEITHLKNIIQYNKKASHKTVTNNVLLNNTETETLEAISTKVNKLDNLGKNAKLDANIDSANLELIKLVKYLLDIKSSENTNMTVKDRLSSSKIEKLLESTSGSLVGLFILLLLVIISSVIIVAYKMIYRIRITPSETINLVET